MVGAILPQHRLEHLISPGLKVQSPASPGPRGVVDNQYFQPPVFTQDAGSIPQLLVVLHKHAVSQLGVDPGCPILENTIVAPSAQGNVPALTSQSPGSECPHSLEPQEGYSQDCTLTRFVSHFASNG